MSDQQTDKESIWAKRIKLANDYHQEWENLFQCEELEGYYEGNHWKNAPANYKPYTINYYYSTIKNKMANYLFARPKFEITPRPGYAEYDIDNAVISAKLKEDVLNNIIRNPNSNFKEEVKSAFLDSMFRYGIIEVGYGADWITNPNADKPLLRSDHKIDVEESNDRILKEPDEIPDNERIYFRRIHAKRFRVGGVDSEYLSRCSWVGYYDFVERRHLLKNSIIKNKNRLKNGVTSRTADYIEYKDKDEELLKGGDIVKIWHIWDIRSKKRTMLLDNPMMELWEDDFSRLPLFDLRWDTRTHGWYPIPPSFQWISPQDEINESREQLRSYRQRFTQKFQILEGSIDDEERDKFDTGPSGTSVIVKRDGAIQPIQMPSVGNANPQMMVTAKDDLNIVSGTSAEARGVADRVTATQATIVEQKSQVREDAEAEEVYDWMRQMGREALLQARDKFVFGTWVELTADATENFLGEVQDKQPSYQYVTGEDLSDGYDFKVDVDITSMSPIKAEEEKRRFLEFLTIVQNFPQIALSPKLVRKAALVTGVRDEAVIKEMQQMALLTMLGANQQAGGDPGNQFAQQAAAQMTPNDQEQIRQQMEGQLLQ